MTEKILIFFLQTLQDCQNYVKNIIKTFLIFLSNTIVWIIGSEILSIMLCVANLVKLILKL